MKANLNKVYHVASFVTSIIILMIASSFNANAADVSFGYAQGVPNSTEHHVADHPDYNENNELTLYVVKFNLGLVTDNKQLHETHERHLVIYGGHMFNSLDDFTEINGIDLSNCVGKNLKLCVGSGVSGFRGYDFAKDMFDGFSYIPNVNTSIIYQPIKQLSVEHRTILILPAMVSTQAVSINFHAKIDTNKSILNNLFNWN